jgi:uncharacterized repeat protein (TIGR01451 family)
MLERCDKKIKNKRLIAMQYVLASFLYFVCQSALAFPLPGSQITNVASGDFADSQGNIQIINSNPVSLVIQKVFALDLAQNQQQVDIIGGKLNFPHILTNTGNTVDDYQLSLVQATNDQFDLNEIAVYVDRDQDGLPDDNKNLLIAGSLIKLDAGKSISVIVAGTIPSNATLNQQATFNLTATSAQNNTLLDSVQDTATVVDDAVIHVTKSQSVSAGITGTEITYTFTYTNTGTASRRLFVEDQLNTALQYQNNSALWSNGSGALSDANDGIEAGANAGVNYRVVSGNKIEFEITSVAALSTGSIRFKVIVQDGSVDHIPNTGSYVQYGVGNNTVKSTKTNTVVFNPIPTLGVVANIQSVSAANSGNPNSAPDNLRSESSVLAGQETLFDNYIWNTGEVSDSYNLKVTTSNLPACAQVRLYTADGRTLLVDSTGDGVIDTGSIAQGGVRHIKVGVYTTPTCTITLPMIIDITAESVTNTTVSDPVRNQILQITANGQTDLYNSDNSGLGVGAVDNAGNAWISKPIVAGQQAVFPLVVKNTGTTSNNYHLYASDASIDLNNLSAVQLPTGWSVAFYEGDATCSNLGAQIANSGEVAAGASKQYCAVVTAPANAVNMTLPLWFAVKSPVNQQGDVIKDRVVVEAIRNLILTNDQQGQVQAGGTIVYLHTLQNLGSVFEGDALGEVELNITPQNSADDFVYSLYYDANNNGALDSSDPLATDLATITNNSGLAPNQSIQLLVKVQAPPSATSGMVSQADVVVIPVGTVQGLSAATVKNTDVTTVNPNQLRLIKAQSKDENCNASNFSALSYNVSLLQVKPNQCVVYRLTVKNDGVSSANAVVIQDVVPAFTTLITSPVASASQGTVSIIGDQIKADIGVVAPTQEAHLYFSIRVNP